MKIDLSASDGVLRLYFRPVAENRAITQEVSLQSGFEDRNIEIDRTRMAREQCRFHLPDDWSSYDIHPDLLALVCILICQPYVDKCITLPFAVSESFASHYRRSLRREIQPVDPSIEPRKVRDEGVPALAFSGGVDSTAALALMPNETIPFFLDRIFPEDQKDQRNLYNKDAAYFACEGLAEHGYDVQTVETDLEFVRKPVGFPIDVACATPAILLADRFNIDSIAFGTIMESAYRIGHLQYLDYPRGSHYNIWGGLFRTAGVPFNQVVAGVSEVGTSKIVLESPLCKYSQSCMRGERKVPCRSCWKCFRKTLLDGILRKERFSDEYLDELFQIKEAQRFITKIPIKHENVIMYLSSFYHGDHDLFSILKARVRGGSEPVEWMEQWYPPSLELIPQKYRDGLVARIKEYLEPMDQKAIEQVEGWDLRSMVESQEYKDLHEDFLKLLFNKYVDQKKRTNTLNAAILGKK